MNETGHYVLVRVPTPPIGERGRTEERTYADL